MTSAQIVFLILLIFVPNAITAMAVLRCRSLLQEQKELLEKLASK